MKFKITNTTASTPKGPRNIFLTEAGALLRPGDTVSCNRVDGGTRQKESAGELRIEEGVFAQTKAPPPKATVAPVSSQPVVEKPISESLPGRWVDRPGAEKGFPEPTPATDRPVFITPADAGPDVPDPPPSPPIVEHSIDEGLPNRWAGDKKDAEAAAPKKDGGKDRGSKDKGGKG